MTPAGEPVAFLLENDPFPDEPPNFIRAECYVYEFTDEREEGRWWRRRRVGEYLPPVSRADDAGLRKYLETVGVMRPAQ